MAGVSGGGYWTPSPSTALRPAEWLQRLQLTVVRIVTTTCDALKRHQRCLQICKSAQGPLWGNSVEKVIEQYLEQIFYLYCAQ